MDDRVKCITPWDNQSRRIYGTEGVYRTLDAGQAVGGQFHGVLILNDQGGSVMDVSEKAACLRAQDHGHPGIICFEPGIAKREGGADRFVKDKCTTIRANMGDNQPAVCYAIEGNGARPSHQGNGYSDDGTMYTLNTIEKHAVCYEISAGTARKGRENICQTLRSRMGTGGGNLPIVVIENECISNDNRGAVREQPSRQLHRTGRIQRYASSNQEE